MTDDSRRKTFRISYYGPIRSIVHRSEELLSLESPEDATVMNILRILSKTYGSQFQELVFHNGTANPALNVFVDGKCLRERREFEVELTSNSEIDIVFISQAAGG